MTRSTEYEYQKYHSNSLAKFVIVGIILLSLVISYYNTRDIQLRIAYGGWGPQDYVNHKLKKENFFNDYPNGIMNYDYSIPMKIYYFLEKYLSISPSITIYPFMVIQILFYLFAIFLITFTLFKSYTIAFISTVILSLSNLAGLDLSRYAFGYASYMKYPLFYTSATGFSLVGIKYFLENRYTRSAVFIVIAVYCHLNIGLLTVAFVGSYFVFRPAFFRNRDVKLAILIFGLSVLPQVAAILSTASVLSTAVPTEEWVKATRMFSFHFYPITMKLFTRNAHREFFPMVIIAICFVMSLKYVDARNEKNTKVIFGCLGCLFLGVLGVIFSDIWPKPVLIKMCLQRATGLISFFGVIYFINYLIVKVRAGEHIEIFLAIYVLMTLSLAKPGIALAPVLALLYYDLRDGHVGAYQIRNGAGRVLKLVFFIAVGGFLFLSTNAVIAAEWGNSGLSEFSRSFIKGLWSPLAYLNPFHRYDFFLRGGKLKAEMSLTYALIGCVLAWLIVAFSRHRGNSRVRGVLPYLLLMVSVAMVAMVERSEYLSWHNRYGDVAKAYLEVQEWAKKNTSNDSLFMPDPTHYYGWRDFSERSSFGNFREWGYSSIVYNSDAGAYQDGLQRMSEFGVKLKDVTNDEINRYPGFPYSQKLTKHVRKVFYKLRPQDLSKLCKKYEIDYVVMKKRYIEQDFMSRFAGRFKSAYQNDIFVVLSPVYSIETTATNEIILERL